MVIASQATSALLLIMGVIMCVSVVLIVLLIVLIGVLPILIALSDSLAKAQEENKALRAETERWRRLGTIGVVSRQQLDAIGDALEQQIRTQSTRR